MASYDAQINILVAGQRNISNLTNQLNAIEDSIEQIERRWRAASSALQRSQIRLNVAGTEQPRGEGGRFVRDPDRQARFAAFADRRRATVEQRLARLSLSRTTAEAAATRGQIEDNQTLLRQVERRITLESQLNSAVTTFQRQQRAYARGGGGARLTEDLQQRAAAAQAAFEAAGGPLTRNLQLVKSLAREMTAIAESQREVNRGSTLQSKAFYKSQEFERRIASLREAGVPVESFRTVGRQMAEYRSAVARTNQPEAENVARRIDQNLKRISRELDAAFANFKKTDSARRAASSWQTFFEDAASLALQVKQNSAQTKESWRTFFEDAANQALQIKQSAANTKQSWRAFFEDAAQQALSVRQNATETRKNWQSFFEDAAQQALQIKENAKSTKESWGTFFGDAANYALEIKQDAVSTKNSWKLFFEDAAEQALQIKQSVADTRNSWRSFFEDAANQALQIKQVAAETRGSWQQFFNDAANQALQIKQEAKETGQSWKLFFDDAAQQAFSIKESAKQTRLAWQQFFSDAEEQARAYRSRPIAAMTPQERVSQGILDPDSLRAQRRRRVEIGRLDPLERFYAGFQSRRQAERSARATSEGLIGGAFPLLFGQGLGASIGGGVGGFAGGFAGGGLGFGLSLIGTALGTALDTLSQAAQDTGKALKYPTESFEKLKEAGLFASRQQEYYISKLIESGRIQQAQVEIQTEIIKKIGVSGVNDLTDLGDSSTRLSKAWADFNLQLQVALAGPMAGLLDWIASVVRLSTATIQQQAMNLDPAAFEQARGRAASSASRFGIVGNKSKYESELNRLSQEIVDKNLPKLLPKSSTLTPEEQETVFQKSRQVADEIKSAYREGFQLQQQSIDLQRQGAELQRRIAEDIFNKQQQIQRRQIEADQLRKQIAIETADLEYRRRIANEEGRVAEVLAAEAEVMRTKAEGEAQIESKKRMLELDIAKQKRETENYIYQLNKEIDGIRRATLNYEMEVADYRLKIQRQIEDEARIAEAKRKAGGAKLPGFSGGAFTSRKRDPDAEKTGWDIVMPGGRGAGVRSPIDLTITGTGFQGKGAGSTGKGYGNWITGEFKLGGKTYELLLGHFDKINVAKGAKIPAGGMLGAQGITGRTFGAHVTTHVNPLKGASVGDAWNALNTITKAWESGEAINPLVSQYQSASSGIKRPNVPMVSPGAVGGQMTTLNARDEAIQRQSLNLEQQLTKLREQGALQRLYEVAQGEKDIAQRRQALSLAKAEFSVIGAVSQDRQDSLLFEAQALEKIITRKAEDEKILQNTKLQGQERQKLIDQLAIGLSNTQKQIELDRELLALAQQRRFEEEKTGLQRQIQTTGAGLGAGFVGGAAQAYESELMRSGSAIKAREIAELTNQLTLAQVQAEGMQQSVLAVGDAFGTAMTTGVAELVKGTTTAQEVFAQFLNAVANALLQAAAQMIATYVAIGIARMFAGFGGKGGDGGNAATALGSNPNVAKYAPLANGGVFDGGFTAFAKGGMFTNSIVSSPTLFRFADGAGFSAGLMGEAGPEAIMPLTRGPGGRLGVDASGSGESINVTVNVDASGSKVQGDDQSANQLGRVVANAVQQELIKQKRPGGLLS